MRRDVQGEIPPEAERNANAGGAQRADCPASDAVNNKKKQIPLRLSAKLYEEIAVWAQDDFRSVNGQIEYLLTECVRARRKGGKYAPGRPDDGAEHDVE